MILRTLWLLFLACFGTAAAAEPNILFNLAPDLPAQTRLSLTAFNQELQPFVCTLQVQATLIYANDPTPHGTILIPNVKMRVMPGMNAEPVAVGEEELINQGVPGLRYAFGGVLQKSCSPEIPEWEIEPDSYFYFIAEFGQFPNPRERTQGKSIKLNELNYADRLSFSADGMKMLVANRIQNSLYLYSVYDKRQMWTFPLDYYELVYAARLSRDGRYAIVLTAKPSLTIRYGATLRVYDTVQNKLAGSMELAALPNTAEFKGYDDVFFTNNFDVSPTEDVLVMANPLDPGKGLTLYSLPELKDVGSFGASMLPKSPVFSKDGKRIAASENGKHVSIYDRSSLQVVQGLDFEGVVAGVDFGPSGHHVAVGAGKKVYFWTLDSTESPRMLYDASEERDPLYNIKVSPDGRFISLGTARRASWEFNLQYGSRVPEMPAPRNLLLQIDGAMASPIYLTEMQPAFFGNGFTPIIQQFWW